MIYAEGVQVLLKNLHIFWGENNDVLMALVSAATEFSAQHLFVCFIRMDAFQMEGSGYPIRDFVSHQDKNKQSYFPKPGQS